MTSLPNVLTLIEAAVLLRMSTRTIVKLALARKLPGRKVGNQWRFLRSELEAYLVGTWQAAS